MKMSSHLKAELAVTCSTLGRLHKGEYLIEPECIESVKDLIRYLKRDNESYEIRRYLGESKVLPNDLVHIIKSCPEDDPDLFDVTLRLLINLTTPPLLFYGEEIPEEKTARNIYLSLVGYSQDYKFAFCDVEFWNKICGKLTDLFEIDWAERSVDDSIQIERILMLLRNVLQVPADLESEKRPENDITVHDKVLWALRQSQILELLLFITSNVNEEQYYLNLLEIFSLILREQNPKLLAHCDIQHSAAEKSKDTEALMKVRESEKLMKNKYVYMRNFNTTFVVKGVKSLSNNDIVCHKSLDKASQLDLNRISSKKVKIGGSRVPIESEQMERRSTFSVRLFLKEFCLEFLSNSFDNLMSVVKNKLDSGKSLSNDQTYYFWAMKFFLDFATASNSRVDLIKSFLSSETFHFILTSIENAFDHLVTDKKKKLDWVKRIHLILKAYRSLLETLLWLDSSKSPLVRSVSREIKAQIFYVIEYREMTLKLLHQYDSSNFSVSYLRDLIETSHLFIKLLEEYSKQTKLLVQKIIRKKSSSIKNDEVEKKIETREEKWEKIKDDVYDILCSESCFPEIPPFDAALDIPIDDQKGRAMKNIQKLLLGGNIKQGIGLLRSARQVWPENECFGAEGMSVEDETMAFQEICLADLGEIDNDDAEKVVPPADEASDKEDEDEVLDNKSRVQIVEEVFDVENYKKRLVNRKVIESCGILLKNYNKNSDHTNHCAIKLLHRIGWECCMPAMLYQASLFWTLFKIMQDKTRNYQEINTFTVNLLRKFRKHAEKTPVVFLELLFWKEKKVAYEIQQGYEPYEKKPKGKKSKEKLYGGEEEVTEKGAMNDALSDIEKTEISGNSERKKSRKKKTKSKKSKSQVDCFSEDENDDERSPSLKIATELSTALFTSSKESDDDGVSAVREKTSPKITTELSEASQDAEEKKNCSNVKIIEPAEKQTKVRLIRKRSRKEKKERKSVSSLESQSQATRTEFTRRRAFIYSSDEEKEDEFNSLHDSLDEGAKPQKPFFKEKDSDLSDSSRTSTGSKKKKALQGKKRPFVVDELISKSKRLRYVGSDSDEDDFGSKNVEFFSTDSGKGKKRRRRLAMIDSDSDMDTSLLDDK